MTIIVTWQLRVALDSISHSCDVFVKITLFFSSGRYAGPHFWCAPSRGWKFGFQMFPIFSQKLQLPFIALISLKISFADMSDNTCPSFCHKLCLITTHASFVNHWITIDANGEPQNHSFNGNGSPVKTIDKEKQSCPKVQMWNPLKTIENNG